VLTTLGLQLLVSESGSLLRKKQHQRQGLLLIKPDTKM